jgi:hypothetical protein
MASCPLSTRLLSAAALSKSSHGFFFLRPPRNLHHRPPSPANGVLSIRASYQDLDSASVDVVSRGIPELLTRAEGLLYTIADAAVSADPAVATTQQNRDWLSGLTDGLESILKVRGFFFHSSSSFVFPLLLSFFDPF